MEMEKSYITFNSMFFQLIEFERVSKTQSLIDSIFCGNRNQCKASPNWNIEYARQ